jgi:undecaprenyl-diphosphatase
MRRSTDLAHLARIVEWDRTCTRVLNRAAMTPSCARVCRLVSRLGDGAIWYALIAGLALTAGAPGRQCALHMLLAGTAAVIVYTLLKRSACRQRPSSCLEGLCVSVPPLDQFSFPSGHTLHAFAFTTIAVAYFPALAFVLVPFSCLTALSRIVLALHYPSDVLAGAVIGSAVALASFHFI